MEVVSVCVCVWRSGNLVRLCGCKAEKTTWVYICVLMCGWVFVFGVWENPQLSPLQKTTAADKICRPPDEHSDHSLGRLSQRGSKTIDDTGNADQSRVRSEEFVKCSFFLFECFFLNGAGEYKPDEQRHTMTYPQWWFMGEVNPWMEDNWTINVWSCRLCWTSAVSCKTLFPPSVTFIIWNCF